MKTFTIMFACMAAILMPSCSIECDDAPRQVDLLISVADPSPTKVTGASVGFESEVSSLQVLVFDGDGALVSYGASSSSSVLLRCVCGRMDVWAFANAPSLSSILRLQDLMSYRFSLEDNTPASLLMFGNDEISVDSDLSTTMQLSRMCAKVVLHKLTKSLSSDVLSRRTMTVGKIYMTNAVSETSVSGPVASAAWFNKMGWKGECDRLLCDNVGREVTSSLDEDHTFYVYPNPVTEDIRGGTWAPRFSRLVVETSLDGETGYYVIDIPEIKANCSYDITDLRITRQGASDEEHRTFECCLDFSLSVTPWTAVPEYHENL